MKKKIMTGKGKEYSKVAREIENTFSKWLQGSSVDEDNFMKEVDGKYFYLTYYEDEDMAIIVCHNAVREIAQPLVWQKENGIALKSYKMDAALLLAYVRDKSTNNESKEKIRKYIHEYLID